MSENEEYSAFDISRMLAMYGYQVIKIDELEALRQQNAQMYECLQEADVAVQSYIEDYGDNDGCLVGILKGVRAAIAATWTEENRG